MNDYNKTPGDPTIREGNWVEERALRDFTGNTRKYDTTDPTQTAKRNVFHSGCPTDWSTQTGSIHHKVVHEPDANGTVSVSTALPRVSLTKKEQYLIMAQQLVDDDDVAEAKKIEDDINNTRFEGCKPMNRARALNTQGRVPAINALYEPAVTKYSADPANTDRITGIRSGNPFGKSTAFTKPECEFTEDTNR